LRPMDPDSLYNVVSYVTGRVIEVEGGRICLENGWSHGPSRELDRRWTAAEAGPAVRELLKEAPTPEPVYGAQ
ncbi:short-chain dehydrogenase, partial [Amycolatopsis sp. NPDC000673]